MNREQYDALHAMGLRPVNHRLDGFAAACYETNTVDELIDFNTAAPDPVDMETWGITPDEWRQAARAALETGMFWFDVTVRGGE